MKKSEIVTTIINHFFSFDAERGGGDDYSLDEFIGYLNSRSVKNDMVMRKVSGDKDEWLRDEYRSTTIDISILVVLLYHYAKGYIKKALRDSVLQTPDEFSFLITLMTYADMTKSELIHSQVMEKTSGSEVIRRLIKRGLIIEFEDENDRRSVRVAITEKGREEVVRILPSMAKVSEIVVGNLNVEEINTLSYLLKKLDYFHNDIYLNRRGQSLNDLLDSIPSRRN